MEMKEVYEKLEQMEGGAELITAIKSEVSKLNGEAKANRENGDKSAAKIKAILENLGLEDGDDVLEKAKEVKSTLDTFRQGNKAPSEVAKQITDLTKQVAERSGRWDASSMFRRTNERAPHLSSLSAESVSAPTPPKEQNEPSPAPHLSSQ